MAKPTANGAAEMWQHRIIGYGFEDPAQLLANEANWRIHPLAQQQALSGVMEKVGWVANVLINKRTDPAWGASMGVETVVDGHLRVMDAISKQQPKVPTAYVDLLPDEEALILATYDSISAMAVTDSDKLSELLAGLSVDMKALTAGIPTIDEVLAGLNGDEPPGDPGAQVDRAAELQQKWNVARGDLWQIGRHRLLCGDSTSAEDVARVMRGERINLVVTSPPYNQQIDTFKPSGMQKESPSFVDRMAGAYADCLPEDEYQRQQIDLLEMLRGFMADNGSIFYNHKIRYRDKAVLSPMEWLTKLSFPIRQEIIWDRGSSITLNARMFIPADERIYWLRAGNDFVFNDSVDVKSWSTVWDIGAHNDVSVSAAFANEIPLRCIQACSRPNDIVADVYCGSGTTLVACEQTGRVGRGVEIEPKYCAVILERLAGMGLTPERVA